MPRAAGDVKRRERAGTREPCQGVMQDRSRCKETSVATVRYTCPDEDVRERRFCAMHVRLLQRRELYCLRCAREGGGRKVALILLEVRWD